MKKLATISAIILFVLILFKYGAEAYYNRGGGYPEGSTVNSSELYMSPGNVFYTSDITSDDNLFSGVVVKYHPNGKLKTKGGVKNGKLHGQFDCWYESGQKQASLVWINGVKYRGLRAYYPSGNKIERDKQEIINYVFYSGELIEE
jgi:antitoxin component YwqK of YwqJK toxin-antitoxin module